MRPGLQCAATMKTLTRAMRVGRVDVVVQSTDKNFAVPVGGAVIASGDKKLVEAVGSCYPGRASAGPIQDLFITLLSMGAEGYRGLLADREALVEVLRSRLAEVAGAFGERVLSTPKNHISFGMTLNSFDSSGSKHDATYLGSMLFTRCISGTRVVRKGEVKTICGIEFQGFGSSIDNYSHTYLTAACAIGLRREEIDRFIEVLHKTMASFQQKKSKELEKRSLSPSMTEGSAGVAASEKVTPAAPAEAEE